MQLFDKSIIDIIMDRFSCRTFKETPIPSKTLDELQKFIDLNTTGPFGENHRFMIVSASQADSNALKGLGTYGFIKGATAFLIGASKPSGKYLEDFGYLMEKYILAATAFGLGSCWLGGSFTRSRFSRKISLQHGEELPAVTALGLMDDPEKAREGFIRNQIGSHKRRSWETMFHNQDLYTPLEKSTTVKFSQVLEMVRLGPSASNKQPWQIVRSGMDWHFFLKRTPGYRDGKMNKTLTISDLQRVDIGIAMCHFELSAEESGLKGFWQIKDHQVQIQDDHVKYIVTWSQESK